MDGLAGCSVRSFHCLPLPDSTKCFPYGGASISCLQEPMLDFAQGVFRKRLHRDELDGNFVRTEPTRGILMQCLRQRWRHRAVRNDVGHYLFAIDGIVPTDDGRLADSW